MTDTVIIQNRNGGQPNWLFFLEPLFVVQTYRVDDIHAQLRLVERAVADGYFAAGFISYEAAPAFDPAFTVRLPSALPLLWFGIFRRKEDRRDLLAAGDPLFKVGQWRPSVSEREYKEAIKRIKRHIVEGDTYQVNYTFRLRARFQGNPFGLWRKLLLSQPEGYAAYVETDSFAICSASPELLFSLRGDELCTRPMKGTASRGRTLPEDRDMMVWLQNSEKNRAENLMIVDMMRNDLGKIAEVGSVEVSNLFAVERYPTVLQMTSTVRSTTSASLAEILGALFPGASVTGAPKIRTMEIIADLETAPRGVYCGAIGYLAPNREAQFNLAIRTVTIDRRNGRAEYGVGGGIVWDSKSGDEYAECLIKAHVLRVEPAQFELLESILWEPGEGYFLLEKHLERLCGAAEYFDYRLDLNEVRTRLSEIAGLFPPAPQKIRLRVARDGVILIDSDPLAPEPCCKTWRVGLAASPVNPSDSFLYHKTTRREIYEAARATRPDCDDVLLWNPKGEITESTIANLVVRKEGADFTPPISVGLLPGTFRAHLLETGRIRERTITIAELKMAREIFLINSVRKWLRVDLGARSTAARAGRIGGPAR
jgi:para-aminobenzoate synthetase/4-amino-4-deoxychorismate lyase